MNKKINKMSWVLCFGLTVLGLLLVSLFLNRTDAGRDFHFWKQKEACSLVTGFMNLLGLPVVQEGNQLHWSGFSLEIIRECDGLMPLLALCVLILAWPFGWKSKILGVFAAIVFVETFNTLRISSSLLFIRAGYSNSQLEQIEGVAFRPVAVVATIVFFLMWFFYFRAKDQGDLTHAPS